MGGQYPRRSLRPLVDATIARLLGRKDRRFEDLAQIAMIEIVRSLSRFRGECSLDTWTARVTAHAVYKEIRRRKVEARVLAPAAEEEVELGAGPDALANLEARSTLRRIREHIAALDPAKAWTLVLHDVSGYDLKEIAEITDCTIAAAQSRLVRGRAELQARLEADPELADMIRGGAR
jgi:RNA polymerase sigma-70 factor (ECF subfamily)